MQIINCNFRNVCKNSHYLLKECYESFAANSPLIVFLTRALLLLLHLLIIQIGGLAYSLHMPPPSKKLVSIGGQLLLAYFSCSCANIINDIETDKRDHEIELS